MCSWETEARLAMFYIFTYQDSLPGEIQAAFPGQVSFLLGTASLLIGS